MRALRFELKGETAFFKKPDVNIHTYFTYSHIHKIALVGMLGAILGLGGYLEQYNINAKCKKTEQRQVFPEFYQVFKKARVSIVPHGDRGYFSKKVQIFNNTVGYASQEAGNVLNVREQWLERPHWTIYVAEDEGLPQGTFDKLMEYILQSQGVYIPYLGKNDHPASIGNPAVVELTSAIEPRFIDSLHKGNSIRCDEFGTIKDDQRVSFFRELMPVRLNEDTNGYVFEALVLTNHEIDQDSISEEDSQNLYCDGERVLYFV